MPVDLAVKVLLGIQQLEVTPAMWGVSHVASGLLRQWTCRPRTRYGTTAAGGDCPWGNRSARSSWREQERRCTVRLGRIGRGSAQATPNVSRAIDGPASAGIAGGSRLRRSPSGTHQMPSLDGSGCADSHMA